MVFRGTDFLHFYLSLFVCLLPGLLSLEMPKLGGKLSACNTHALPLSSSPLHKGHLQHVLAQEGFPVLDKRKSNQKEKPDKMQSWYKTFSRCQEDCVVYRIYNILPGKENAPELFALWMSTVGETRNTPDCFGVSWGCNTDYSPAPWEWNKPWDTKTPCSRSLIGRYSLVDVIYLPATKSFNCPFLSINPLLKGQGTFSPVLLATLPTIHSKRVICKNQRLLWLANYCSFGKASFLKG